MIRFSELTTLTKKEHMTLIEAMSRSFVSATAKEVARYDISSGERSRTIKITSVYSMQGKNRRNKKEASFIRKNERGFLLFLAGKDMSGIARKMFHTKSAFEGCLRFFCYPSNFTLIIALVVLTVSFLLPPARFGRLLMAFVVSASTV